MAAPRAPPARPIRTSCPATAAWRCTLRGGRAGAGGCWITGRRRRELAHLHCQPLLKLLAAGALQPTRHPPRWCRDRRDRQRGQQRGGSGRGTAAAPVMGVTPRKNAAASTRAAVCHALSLAMLLLVPQKLCRRDLAARRVQKGPTPGRTASIAGDLLGLASMLCNVVWQAGRLGGPCREGGRQGGMPWTGSRLQE